MTTEYLFCSIVSVLVISSTAYAQPKGLPPCPTSVPYAKSADESAQLLGYKDKDKIVGRSFADTKTSLTVKSVNGTLYIHVFHPTPKGVPNINCDLPASVCKTPNNEIQIVVDLQGDYLLRQVYGGSTWTAALVISKAKEAPPNANGASPPTGIHIVGLDLNEDLKEVESANQLLPQAVQTAEK